MPRNTDLQRRRKWEAVQGVALFAVIQLAVIGVMVGLCFIPGMPGWCVALFGALAVLTSPVWLPVLFVIFVVGAVLLFVVMLLIFIFGVVAIALLGAGFWALTAYPPTGIAVLGGALICLGLAMLCVLLFMWAGSALKSLMNAYRSRRQH